jgi:hypothetical protein
MNRVAGGSVVLAPGIVSASITCSPRWSADRGFEESVRTFPADRLGARHGLAGQIAQGEADGLSLGAHNIAAQAWQKPPRFS